ncbi:MAG: hypothetical protein ACK5NN_13110 [Sphingomonadaceae bacterium]
MKSTDKLILSGVGIIVAIGVISAAMAPNPPSAVAAENASPEADMVAPSPEVPVFARRTAPVGISSIASGAYTRAEYPTTFRKFGGAVSDINADRLAAANIAALYEDCDYVENSQITTRSPMQNRRYWVECRNLTRLFFDQESLARGEPVEVQTKAVWLQDGLKDW